MPHPPCRLCKTDCPARAAIYIKVLLSTHRISLALVYTRVSGDIYFPAYSKAEWRQVSMERHTTDETQPHPSKFQALERVGRDLRPSVPLPDRPTLTPGLTVG